MSAPQFIYDGIERMAPRQRDIMRVIHSAGGATVLEIQARIPDPRRPFADCERSLTGSPSAELCGPGRAGGTGKFFTFQWKTAPTSSSAPFRKSLKTILRVRPARRSPLSTSWLQAISRGGRTSRVNRPRPSEPNSLDRKRPGRNGCGSKATIGRNQARRDWLYNAFRNTHFEIEAAFYLTHNAVY